MMLRIRLKIIKDYQYVENKYLKLDISLSSTIMLRFFEKPALILVSDFSI